MFSQEKPSVMFDCSVYAPINQCKATDLEKLIVVDRPSDSLCLLVYKDFIGRIRAVLLDDDQPVSGVLLDKTGTIQYKETKKEHSGKKLTRSICAMLTTYGISWQPSEWQTEAGSACYK